MHFDGDPDTRKRTRNKSKNVTSEGVHKDKVNGDHATLSESAADKISGKMPPEADAASSPALDGSPGLLPNVTENELQLDQVQEPASVPGSSVNDMNIEPVQPRLVQVMSVEIFKNPSDEELPGGEIFCLETMHPNWAAYKEPNGLLAIKASADPDMMYHHQVMHEPDCDEFKKAMQKEIDDQMLNGNFTLIEKREVP